MIAARLRENPDFDAIQRTLTLLAESAAKSQDDVAQTLKLAQEIDRLITQRVTVASSTARRSTRRAYSQPGLHDRRRTSGTRARRAQPVVAAIVTSELGVLVGRRNDGKPPWTFISGEVEPGESPADAAVREVKEETALEVRPGRSSASACTRGPAGR